MRPIVHSRLGLAASPPRGPRRLAASISQLIKTIIEAMIVLLSLFLVIPPLIRANVVTVDYGTCDIERHTAARCEPDGVHLSHFSLACLLLLTPSGSQEVPCTMQLFKAPGFLQKLVLTTSGCW